MHLLKIKRIDEGEELNIVAYLNLDWYIFEENLCHLDLIKNTPGVKKGAAKN